MIAVALIVGGLSSWALAVEANSLGLGVSPGFGWKKTFLTVLGLGAMLVGLALLRLGRSALLAVVGGLIWALALFAHPLGYTTSPNFTGRRIWAAEIGAAIGLIGLWRVGSSSRGRRSEARTPGA